MAMNPMQLLKLKDRLNLFRQDHPKVSPFFHRLREEGMPVGTVLELKATLPDGKEYVTSIRLTENDAETLRILGKH